MSQKTMSWVWAANGSSTAVVRSGTSTMSDSLMAFQPAIDEPSNITPSVKRSESTVRTAWDKCCHLPRGSVKRKSTYLTSCSLIMSMTFWVSDIATFRSKFDRAREHENAADNSTTQVRLHPDRVRQCGCGSLPRSS